jgi:hypothetical protein
MSWIPHSVSLPAGPATRGIIILGEVDAGGTGERELAFSQVLDGRVSAAPWNPEKRNSVAILLHVQSIGSVAVQ